MYLNWCITTLSNIILIFGICFLGIYVFFKYQYTYWRKRKVPYLNPSFPLGNNKIIGSEALSYGSESKDWYNAFKKMGYRFGGVWNFYNPTLVLVDTELIKDVMTKDFNNFINRDFYKNPHDDPKSDNLFTLEDEKWRYVRQKISPAFTSCKMRYMFDCVLKCSDPLIELFSKATEVDKDINIRLLVDKYTMDNIGVVAFGLQFNCLLTEDNMLRRIADVNVFPDFKNRIKRLLCKNASGFAKKLGLSLFDRDITSFFSNIIHENVEQRKKLNEKRNDFTQLLLDIKEESEKGNTKFSMDDLIATCLVFFFAGFDTSSKTVQFTLVELARNPTIQEKARNDIKRVLEKYNGQLTYEGLQEMTYVKQVIEETLRCYPPLLTISRICKKNYKLRNSDAIIEKGTTVLISTLGLHRDPDLFPNPDKYDPERFSLENKSNIIPYSYLPFGEGPRNCIGRRFGSMQSAIGLVRILSNFKIELSPKVSFPLPIKDGQFLLETDELYVRATKIKLL